MNSDRQSLRQTLIARRSSLSVAERWHKAVLATQALSQHRSFKRASNIALYMAVDAECPTLPLSLTIEAAGKALHYPRIDARIYGRMQFIHTHDNTHWQNNRYHIPEPLPYHREDITHPRSLDLIVLPLAGFDDQGNRMGMGAGYYDRCLAFRRYRRYWRRPLLIGLAYDCQQTDRIPVERWDVSLDGVATESGLQFFKQTP